MHRRDEALIELHGVLGSMVLDIEVGRRMRAYLIQRELTVQRRVVREDCRFLDIGQNVEDVEPSCDHCTVPEISEKDLQVPGLAVNHRGERFDRGLVELGSSRRGVVDDLRIQRPVQAQTFQQSAVVLLLGDS